MPTLIDTAEPIVKDSESPVGGSTCPLCHTPDPTHTGTLSPTDMWQCTRCGQRWTADRLAAVAAFELTKGK